MTSVSIFTNARQLFVAFLIVVLFSSCVSQKRTKYIQDKLVVSQIQENIEVSKVTKIKPLDDLYIKVVSSDKNLNSSDASTLSTLQAATIYLISYSVNKDGFINYPVLGKVLVKDLTIEELEVKLQKELDAYLSDPSVSVKFVNNFITIIGEVKRPGRFDMTKDKINIFEALGVAGDLTDFGNGQRIAIIQTKDTISQIYYIDITDKNVLKSEHFYLKANDVVYVEPLKAKMWGFTQFPFAITLSLISTTLLLLNYLKK